ncbi:hypothetical protein WJX84_007248 [Apatococcus fuscideae]|uniref:Menin n=1 Tax=Apatococcus fuscideae TaxID=2026836 RepID=A0AAW1SYT2_9CHLO
MTTIAFIRDLETQAQALLPGDKLLEKSRRLLRQFVENDILCPAAASGVAAAAGDLEFIQQAAAEGATLDKNVGYLAAAGGHLHVSEWVFRALPVPRYLQDWWILMMEGACNYGRVEVAQWLLDHGCPWRGSDQHIAGLDSAAMAAVPLGLQQHVCQLASGTPSHVSTLCHDELDVDALWGVLKPWQSSAKSSSTHIFHSTRQLLPQGSFLYPGALRMAQAVVRNELSRNAPDIAKISIVLGAIEGPLTVKDGKSQQWPRDLQADVAEATEHFSGFLVEARAHFQKLPSNDSRGKVKAVADLIWSKLTNSYAKDILHAQSVWTFTRVLAAGKGKGKRQLDCAGVVTTTLAVCQALAQDANHTDLASCRFQVSEDHCWLTLAESGEREASIEITTDAADKRGLPVDAAAWDGWLYSGGHATVCTPQMCAAALVASINPSIVARQNTGTDSEGVQLLQESLLRLIHTEFPGAMYPAALCALGDLYEIWDQEDLQTALTASDATSLTQQLESTASAALGLFRQGIDQSRLDGGAPGYLWYPYGYVVGFLARRAQFLLKSSVQQLLGPETATCLIHPCVQLTPYVTLQVGVDITAPSKARASCGIIR